MCALFLLSAAATLTIWIRDPYASWGYECAAFTLAACFWKNGPGWSLWTAALCAVSLWGFVQLTLGATVYRYATMDASLHWAALVATALVAACVLEDDRVRTPFLRAFVWFGFLVSILAVLAYFTSSGKVFWLFPSGYPDVWGPFPSRNNFAQFLELSLPVALWFFITRGGVLYAMMAAAMLAAGLASASRAGFVLLLSETIVVFAVRRRRLPWQLIVATVAFAAVMGVGQLERRLLQPEPMQYRREMARSTLTMIAARPWNGFGLGTFGTVYPAYAEFDSGALVDHAHNDWLEWASEGGLPFAACWALLFLCVAGSALRSGWGLGVLAVFLHALVDYPFARFGVAAWAFALAGALTGEKSRVKSTN
jgi:O-antigen ligase